MRLLEHQDRPPRQVRQLAPAVACHAADPPTPQDRVPGTASSTYRACVAEIPTSGAKSPAGSPLRRQVSNSNSRCCPLKLFLAGAGSGFDNARDRRRLPRFRRLPPCEVSHFDFANCSDSISASVDPSRLGSSTLADAFGTASAASSATEMSCSTPPSPSTETTVSAAEQSLAEASSPSSVRRVTRRITTRQIAAPLMHTGIRAVIAAAEAQHLRLGPLRHRHPLPAGIPQHLRLRNPSHAPVSRAPHSFLPAALSHQSAAHEIESWKTSLPPPGSLRKLWRKQLLRPIHAAKRQDLSQL